MQRLKKEFREFVVLLKSVPPVSFSLFVLSIVAMNLLANKSIDIPVDFLALDCGITVSWIAFLSMDVLTKHFGPKAATQLSVFALLINLLLCLLFFVSSVIPGTWGESFVEGSENIINSALNNTFGGAWYVVLGSSAAFVVSALVNNFLNFAIGKLFKKNPDGFAAFACRTYVSTAIGQFADNIVFALIVSHFFFGWTLLQCVTCALTGMIAEFLCELVFSPVGFRICKRWKRDNVGRAYFDLKEITE
ncbi:MAG: VUT family protein [Corallococcus sp.]|nr:VUT family protein [Bacillota bacterium]MCM1533089.1 VUT family protein [Corallococcus sp.]